MKPISLICLAAPLLMIAGCKPAAAPPGPETPPRRIATDLAREGVDAAIAACTAQGLKVGGAVTDSNGNPVYVLVPEGVMPFAGELALRKGATIAITGKPASETEKLAASDTAIKDKLAANPRTIDLGGGVPLMAGGVMVGALSVSGASAEQDEVCAKAGAEAIATRL